MSCFTEKQFKSQRNPVYDDTKQRKAANPHDWEDGGRESLAFCWKKRDLDYYLDLFDQCFIFNNKYQEMKYVKDAEGVTGKTRAE